MFALIQTSDNVVQTITTTSPVFTNGYWVVEGDRYSYLNAESKARVVQVTTPVSVGDTVSASGLVTAAPAVAQPVVVPTPVVEDPRLFWVDQGPFIDRFDSLGYAGLRGLILALGRTNDVVYAAFADMSIRKYIDLKGRRVELLATLTAIAAVIATLGRPALTLSMREAILDTPTTEAERYIKNLV